MTPSAPSTFIAEKLRQMDATLLSALDKERAVVQRDYLLKTAGAPRGVPRAHLVDGGFKMPQGQGPSIDLGPATRQLKRSLRISTSYNQQPFNLRVPGLYSLPPLPRGGPNSARTHGAPRPHARNYGYGLLVDPSEALRKAAAARDVVPPPTGPELSLGGSSGPLSPTLLANLSPRDLAMMAEAAEARIQASQAESDLAKPRLRRRAFWAP